MKEIKISGKVLFVFLICVIAISGAVFATTIVGISGTSAVPNYNDDLVATTATSFVSDVSNGYKEPVIVLNTGSGSGYSGSGYSGSSSTASSSRGGSRFYFTYSGSSGSASYTSGTGPVHWPTYTPPPQPITPTIPSH